MVEIERKFHVILAKLPELTKANRIPIDQHYIFIGKDGEVRIRRKGDKYYYTIKGGGDLVREEREKQISYRTYEELVPLSLGSVSKDRIEIPLPGGKTGELDLYRGHLEGHMTVEVEFASEEEAKAFRKPDWFGKEITADKRFKNKNLAVNGWPV